MNQPNLAKATEKTSIIVWARAARIFAFPCPFQKSQYRYPRQKQRELLAPTSNNPH
jgi:hypothetical protein